MKKKIICPECEGCGYITHVETWEYEDGTGGGQAWSEPCANCNGTGEVEVPMTNYEYIRAMDIEDMAECLRMLCSNSDTCRGCPIENCARSTYSTELWITWLKQEFKGD